MARSQESEIIADLERAIQELKNPSGNPYHAQTFVNRAKANLDSICR